MGFKLKPPQCHRQALAFGAARMATVKVIRVVAMLAPVATRGGYGTEWHSASSDSELTDDDEDPGDERGSFGAPPKIDDGGIS